MSNDNGANIRALCFFDGQDSSRIAFVAENTVVAYEYTSTRWNELASWTRLSVNDSKIKGSGKEGRLALSFKTRDELLLLNRECKDQTLQIKTKSF